MNNEEIVKAILDWVQKEKQISRYIPHVINVIEDLENVIKEAGVVKMFEPGDTVVFDAANLNPNFWDKLEEQQRIEFYSNLGYGSTGPVTFTFLAHMKPQNGHCVLVNIRNGDIVTMVHTNNLRLATEDET